jgi:biotin carboxyl carrier protein
MSKKLNIKVNGKPFEVEVGDFSGSFADVTVNGKSYAIEIEEASGALPASPVVKTISPAAAAAPVKSTPAPSAPAVTIGAEGEDVIIAPMPGVILDITVKPGDKVTAGTIVCALEAMKMKNMLRSQRDGTIASVEVSEGQRVPYGAVIVRFA